jgi:hypothetical protein
MTSTLYPSSAKEAPRLTAVVLFPTPPFWFATAITRAIFGEGASEGTGCEGASSAEEDAVTWLPGVTLLEAPAALFCPDGAFFGGEADEARAAPRLVTAGS